jgi:hypothetical protein
MTIRILILTALLMATPAWAHGIAKGPNGGRVLDVAQGHVELVARDNVIDVFLTDKEGKSVSAAGHKGFAILLIGGKSQRVTLDAAGKNRLTGKTIEAVPGAPKGVVRITRPDGSTSQAKFE